MPKKKSEDQLQNVKENLKKTRNEQRTMLHEKKRKDLNKARRTIIQKANVHKLNHRSQIFNIVRTWTAKNINEAVHYVRQHNLVKEEVLQTAGFNPKKRK